MTEATGDQRWSRDLGIDVSVAHPARVYDYWLGGRLVFGADGRGNGPVSNVGRCPFVSSLVGTWP
jgi:hypothetical protein